MATVTRNRFHLTVALAMAMLIVAGFSRTYYLRAVFALPPLSALLHLHGVIFTAWLAVFVTQTGLIARHNVRAHMKLGVAGTVLAGLVVAVGIITAFASIDSPRPRPMGLPPLQFLAIPLVGITEFAVCVGAALLLRRRSDYHKRLMVLGMIAVLGPPTARLVILAQAGEHFLLIQTLVAASFVIWCLMNDWLRYRVIHPVYAIGGTLLVLSWPLRFALATSALWASIAHSLL